MNIDISGGAKVCVFKPSIAAGWRISSSAPNLTLENGHQQCASLAGRPYHVLECAKLIELRDCLSHRLIDFPNFATYRICQVVRRCHQRRNLSFKAHSSFPYIALI